MLTVDLPALPTDIKKKDDETPETQQPALTSPSASRRNAGHRKRKTEIESNDKKALETKRKAVMDISFNSGRAEINHRDKSTHGSEYNDEASKTEIQALRERTEKNGEIIKNLFQAIDILGNRLTRAENLIQEHDRKHFDAITSLRRDLNRTDGHVLGFLTERDRINNTVIQALNSFIRPSNTA